MEKQSTEEQLFGDGGHHHQEREDSQELQSVVILQDAPENFCDPGGWRKDFLHPSIQLRTQQGQPHGGEGHGRKGAPGRAAQGEHLDPGEGRYGQPQGEDQCDAQQIGDEVEERTGGGSYGQRAKHQQGQNRGREDGQPADQQPENAVEPGREPLAQGTGPPQPATRVIQEAYLETCPRATRP